MLTKAHALDHNTVENDYNFLNFGSATETFVFGTVYQRFGVSPAVKLAQIFLRLYLRNDES